MSLDATVTLPEFHDVFHALRLGNYLSSDSSKAGLYQAFRANKADYVALFGAMGYVLEDDEHGFCYLTKQDRSRLSAKAVALLAMLVRDLASNGRDVTATIFQDVWSLRKLPVLATDRSREIMALVDVGTDKDLRAVIVDMAGAGIVEWEGEGQERFRFLSPVHRFLDMCRDVLARADRPAAPGPVPADGEVDA